MKYLIVIEKTGTGYSAYSPDLDGLRQDGAPVPAPHASSSYVDVPA